jgi:4-carboxymuconolactone decarboxylase
LRVSSTGWEFWQPSRMDGEKLMPRLPDIVVDDLSPEQRRVYDAILAGPRGKVEGPLRVWLNSAELADSAQALGAFCRYRTILPPRLSELAIITTGAFWRAGYEWAVHAPIAVKAGLDPEVVEAIRKGAQPTFKRSDEAAVYAFAHELLRNRKVSEATYRQAETELSSRALVDLVGILGYYSFISMTIVAFDIALPKGASEPFAEKAES